MRKLFLIPLILFACTKSSELSNASIQGLASVPAHAKKEPYADNPNLVKVTIEQTPGLPSEQGDYLNGQKHGTWTAYQNKGPILKLMTGVSCS